MWARGTPSRSESAPDALGLKPCNDSFDVWLTLLPMSAKLSWGTSKALKGQFPGRWE
jgi:hypothetical protein